MKTLEPSATEPAPASPGPAASEAPSALGGGPAPSAPARRAGWLKFAQNPTFVFVIIWLSFDAWLNARYPGEEPALWYLIPSPDLIVIFLCFLLGGQVGAKLPKVVRGGLLAWLFLVRLIRFGDGFQERYYSQSFNLYTDLPLVPELVRFTYSTLAWWQFGLLALGVIVLLVAAAVIGYRALGYAENYLHDTKHAYWFGGLGAVAFVATLLVGHSPDHDALFRGGFAASVMPRLRHEINFLRNVYGRQAAQASVILRTEERLANMPTNLARLGGKNVHLILIESYGQTVLERPLFQDSIRSTFDAFESELGANGYAIVSNVLDSPTYGGHSWLAHTTLDTGIRTSNQLEYEVVGAKKPKPIATFFRDAGYRTVLVHPGTTRPWPKGEFFNFEQKYYFWNFDYVGPAYSWATMPDQFVLDFVRRRELGQGNRPLFIQYVLVSSHAPWSDLPRQVDDWSGIQNGDIYNRLETTHYPIVWPNFENASEPYIASIKYDFEVLKRYLSDYIKDDSLVIILGDHQPVAEVNGDTDSHGVPIHVLSRSKALLEPFIARGYSPGLRARRGGVQPGLETFLPDFLADFSNASTAAIGNQVAH